jgi:hypothetical protein
MNRASDDIPLYGPSPPGRPICIGSKALMLLPEDYLQIRPDRTLRHIRIRTKSFSVSVGAMMEMTRNRRMPSFQGLSFMILLKGRRIITPRIPKASHRVAHKLMPLSVPTLGWTGFWLS